MTTIEAEANFVTTNFKSSFNALASASIVVIEKLLRTPNPRLYIHHRKLGQETSLVI